MLSLYLYTKLSVAMTNANVNLDIKIFWVHVIILGCILHIPMIKYHSEATLGRNIYFGWQLKGYQFIIVRKSQHTSSTHGGGSLWIAHITSRQQEVQDPRLGLLLTIKVLFFQPTSASQSWPSKVHTSNHWCYPLGCK